MCLCDITENSISRPKYKNENKQTKPKSRL